MACLGRNRIPFLSRKAIINCSGANVGIGVEMNIFQSRRQRAQELMAQNDVAALHVTSRENYFYLTGDIRNVARIFLPQKGEPIVIVFDEEIESAEKATGIGDVRGWRSPQDLMRTFFSITKDYDLRAKKVGFCVHSTPGFLLHRVQQLNPRMTIVESEEVLMPIRYVKDTTEIDSMRKAAEVADKGLEAAVSAIAPGRTEIEVAGEAEYAMRKSRAMRFATSTFVDSGPHSLHLHGGTLRRKIEPGDLVVVDVHPIVDMYACDAARTITCGSPSTQQKRLIKLYAEIQETVLNAMRPNWKLNAVTEMFLKLFTDKGYSSQWISGPVHGVGLEFEEWPHPSHYPRHLQLEMKEDWTLAIGHSLLTARPVGGVRIEDTVLLNRNGGECLTRAPKLFE
jgi:Xaa-Pro dipeptidase